MYSAASKICWNSPADSAIRRLKTMLKSAELSENIKWYNSGSAPRPMRSASFPVESSSEYFSEEESLGSPTLLDPNPYSIIRESGPRYRFLSEPTFGEDFIAKATNIMQNSSDVCEVNLEQTSRVSWLNETWLATEFLASWCNEVLPLSLEVEKGSMDKTPLEDGKKQMKEEESVFKMEEETNSLPASTEVKLEHGLSDTAITKFSPLTENMKVKKTRGEQGEHAKKPVKRHLKPRMKPNKCLHLHEFLAEKLRENDKSIAWTCLEKNEFKLIDSEKVAKSWGERKNKEGMTYEKMARSLRYYYKLGIMRKVPHKRLHFAFGTPKVWKKV